MKKNILILILIFMCSFSLDVYASDFCSSVGILSSINIINKVLLMIQIVIPAILVINCIVLMVKYVLNSDSDAKKLVDTILTKIFISVSIIFIPTIIFSFLDITNSDILNNKDASKCIKCMKSISDCEVLIKTEEIAYDLMVAKDDEKFKKIYEKYKQSLVVNENNTEENLNIEEISGSTVYTSYADLTSSQMKYLGCVAKLEQGSIAGAKAELSLMANLFEIRGKKYGKGGTGLYNYVRKSGWFATAKSCDGSNPGSSYVDAVKEVLVYGNRVFPPYVANHDCWNCNKRLCSNNGFSTGIKGDICAIKTDEVWYDSKSQVSNRNLYKKNNTKIYSIYDKNTDYYVFYAFANSSSDPFGYYMRDYNKYKSLK